MIVPGDSTQKAILYRRRALVLSVWIVFTAGCTRHLLVQDGEVNQRVLGSIEEQTQDTRELRFKEDVTIDVYQKQESKNYFQTRLSDVEEERRRREDVVAYKLGILPEGMSVRQVLADALGQNAGGVYMPSASPSEGTTDDTETEETTDSSGQLFIVNRPYPLSTQLVLDGAGYVTGIDWAHTSLMVHELTHALQDQHFNLNEVLPPQLYAENEDAALARKAIVESEANLVTQTALFGLDLNHWLKRNGLIQYMKAGQNFEYALAQLMNQGIPDFYLKLFVYQYSLGFDFLQDLHNRGGWRAVNRAYETALPESTEQLLWPEKFWGPQKDSPQTLMPLPKDFLLAKESWTKIEENTFGAFLWKILLEDYVSRSDARDVVNGWGGDRYEIWEKGSSSILIWRTLWDSQADAYEFWTVYQELLLQKYKNRIRPHDEIRTNQYTLLSYEVGSSSSRNAGFDAQTESTEFVTLLNLGTAILIVEGAPEELYDTLPAALKPYVAEQKPALKSDTHQKTDGPNSTPLLGAAYESLREQPTDIDKTFFMPHRTLRFGVRAGARMAIDERQITFWPAHSMNVRWGFREHLEWSLPFLFSYRLPVSPSHSWTHILTSGLLDEQLQIDAYHRIRATFSVKAQSTHRWKMNKRLSFGFQGTTVLRMGTLAADENGLRAMLSGGLFVQPVSWLTLHYSFGNQMSAVGQMDWYALTQRPEVRLGSVMQSGRLAQPLVMVRVWDLFYVTHSSEWTVDLSRLTITEQVHQIGLAIDL